MTNGAFTISDPAGLPSLTVEIRDGQAQILCQGNPLMTMEPGGGHWAFKARPVPGGELSGVFDATESGHLSVPPG